MKTKSLFNKIVQLVYTVIKRHNINKQCLETTKQDHNLPTLNSVNIQKGKQSW